MPRVTFIDYGSIDVEKGRRLINVILEADIPIKHPCGGVAQCTACQVRFEEGEPDTMTEAEYEGLQDEGLLGDARLSCQIPVEHDMTIEVLEVKDKDEAEGPLAEPIEPSSERYAVETLRS